MVYGEGIKTINKKDFTIEYYNTEAEKFFKNTVSVDFSRIQELFLRRVKPGGRILDLGCGSGRDSRTFLERGYEVVAVDGSKELAKIASEYIGQDVIVADFREYEPEGTFDGIWACASLLHLPKEDIAPVMRKMVLHLAENGCFYVSFKYGSFEGERNGRYFTNMTEESFKELLEEVPGLAIEEFFVSEDVRPGRESERWLNVMMRKIDVSNNEYKEIELKHIDMIESIVERMAQNSFALKGWTMTLIVAICAFSAAGSEKRFALIAVAPIVAFWFLDSFYLQQERKYRELYNCVIKHTVTTFSMDVSSIKGKKTGYFRCVFSITEWVFYVVCLVAIIAVFIWLQ